MLLLSLKKLDVFQSQAITVYEHFQIKTKDGRTG